MLVHLKTNVIVKIYKVIKYGYTETEIFHKPGEDAWYNISSEFLTFSGITV